MCTLNFIGYNNQDGSKAGCSLIDPRNNRYILSCQLEFECMNNKTKYELLMLRLNKSLNLKVVLEIILRGGGVNQYYQIKHFFIFILRFIYATSVKGTYVCTQLCLMQLVYIQ